MASHLSEQITTNSASKPLNPNAEEYVRLTLTTSHPQPQLPCGQGLCQIPPPMLPAPTCFAFFCLTVWCRTEAPVRLLDFSSGENMGDRMIAANTERPPSPPCMTQKRNLPHGNKCRVLRDPNTSQGHPVIPFPTTMEECNRSRTTTVMIKNIPYYFQRKNLVSILDEHCFQQNQSYRRPYSASTYDFVYLPMDYKKFAHDKRQSNLGYAFVNFTSGRAAFRFFERFNGKKWPGNEKWKVCEVTRAQIQGKGALMRRFKEKVFRCGHPSFRPVEYRPAGDGVSRRRKEISVGRFEEGTPETGKPRRRNEGKGHMQK